MPDVQLPLLSVEDALARIVAWLRDPRRDPNAAYPEPIATEFELSQVLGAAINERIDQMRRQQLTQGMVSYRGDLVTNAPPFHTAVWELCRKGILRPVAHLSNGRDHPPPFGWRFAVTPYGTEWLGNTTGFDVLPTEYSRFAQMLARHSGQFGPGYHSRSQEAVRCYQAHAYLACCVMCGAAAESITLALAIARTGDESRVLRDYLSRGGRGRIERLVSGQQSPAVQESLTGYTELLKYWRDGAAHGASAEIDEEEAFTALLLLMRFARFAEDHWGPLTTTP